jgi:hypothetical protein
LRAIRPRRPETHTIGTSPIAPKLLDAGGNDGD